MRRPSAIVVFVLLLTGCGIDQERIRLDPDQSIEIDAVDSGGAFGRVSLEVGDTIRMPAGWIAADPLRSHAILVHAAYDVTGTGDEGYGSLDWYYSSARQTGMPIIDEPALPVVDGIEVPGNQPLQVMAPGSDDDLRGWLMLPISEADLSEHVILRYEPTGQEFIVNTP